MLVTTTNEIPGWQIQRVIGEVFGLTRRERKRCQDDGDPSENDPAPAPAEEPCKLDHEVAHWLVGQPFGQTASRL